MKKVIVIMVVIVIAAFLYVARNNPSAPVIETSAPNETGAFRPDPSNATFTLDNESITLSKGKNSRSVVPGSALIEETNLMDKFAYGDINADNKEDTVLFLARYGGGSGIFVYLAGYVSGPVTYRGSVAMFIGDRIIPQSIDVSRGIVTIKYLDRQAGEALAAEPTVLASKQFIFKNGEFVER
ncbi:MAG: hypothetical protein HYX23_00695 [Candidatus Zambryskibacteria bacterium]|nr:hypothetical protein [Candidatus Zambryskibacteria bacterium]